MLLRLMMKNFLSFGEEKEFNMFPASRQSNLKHHKYKFDTDVLKLAAIYGANAAGKSNLVKALSFIEEFIDGKVTPGDLYRNKYKFSKNGTPVILALEFLHNSKAYIYGFEIIGNKVITEELYISGLGKKENKLIFERKSTNENETRLTFLDELEKDKEGKVLKKVLEKNIIKSNVSAIGILNNLENPLLEDIKFIIEWFKKCLSVILPESKPGALSHFLDKDSSMQDYANNFISSLDAGIKNIKIETKTLKQYFGENELELIKKLKDDFEETPEQVKVWRNQSLKSDEIVMVKEEGKIVVKKIILEHSGKNEKNVDFLLEEESDGTARLIDYIPLFHKIIDTNKVFVVDEIERSIHPLLIRELISKFSKDENTKGQLIFTTHESHLLDQEIFRQDEIWFAEKDTSGSTDLYPLSDFKEHHSKNIEKGYLNGRYGGIPFLANLKELNWNNHAVTEH